MFSHASHILLEIYNFPCQSGHAHCFTLLFQAGEQAQDGREEGKIFVQGARKQAEVYELIC